MNVLVTGGTGFVGVGVVAALCAAGHRVKVLSRRGGQTGSGWPRSVTGPEFLRGDVADEASLSAAMRRVDAVVHLVGIISEFGAATFENVHVRGTGNVVAAAKTAGISRFIHMSALGTRSMAVSRYHKTKWAAEETVRGSGLAWTIFRPSLIYGRNDQFVNLFARLSRFSPLLPILGSRNARFRPVSLEVVATAFARSLSEPRSIGQAYDLCGPERLTLEQILDCIMAVLGRKAWKVRIPAAVARFQARFLELFYPKFLHKAPPLNRDQVIMLEEGNEGDGSAADRLFGLKHPTFREGIAYLRSA